MMWSEWKSAVAAIRSTNFNFTTGFWKSDTGKNRLCNARSVSAHHRPSSSSPSPTNTALAPASTLFLDFLEGEKHQCQMAQAMRRKAVAQPEESTQRAGLPMKAEAPNTEARSEGTRPERELSEMSRNLRQSRLAREAGMEPKRRLEARRRVLRKQQAERSGKRGPEGELKERSRVTR